MSLSSSLLPRRGPSSLSLSHLLKYGNVNSRSRDIVAKCGTVTGTTTTTTSNQHIHFLSTNAAAATAAPHSSEYTSSQKLAQSFNLRRAEYKKAVSKLRKGYAEEYQLQTKLDEESKKKQQEIVTRQRLERQRLKNIRSAQNAMKQELIRIEQKKAFDQHLEQQQVKREQRNQRFEEARRIVVRELEEQSKNWLTTPQEVDSVLCHTKNPFIEQQLWTRPGSFVGEPAPSSDSKYWRYESHTWKIQKTYPTAKQKLLEQIQEMVYDQSNVDYKVYWNKDRLDYQNELEYKAKLRALVLNEGKRILLLKQKQLMQDQHAEQLHINKQDHIIPPKLDLPVPSTDVLANYEAMEKEGVKVLQQNPTKFFIFANQDVANSSATAAAIAHETEIQGNIEEKEKNNVSEVVDLGKPIGLVDPVRDSSFTNTPYPELIGRLPKPDLRTDKEKKRQEREERMLAAASAASGEDKDKKEVNVEEELTFTGGIREEDIDYEKIANFGDEYDQEWEKGLDPILDKDLLDTPFDQRYTEEDIEWIISKLESKVASLKEIIMLEEGEKALKDIDTFATVAVPNTPESVAFVAGEGAEEIDVEFEAKGNVVDEQFEQISKHDEYDDIMSALTGNDINDLIHIEDKHNVIQTLNDEQWSVIQSLTDVDGSEKTGDELKEALSKVPGLTDEQIQLLVDLELSLAQNADVQRLLKK